MHCTYLQYKGTNDILLTLLHVVYKNLHLPIDSSLLGPVQHTFLKPHNSVTGFHIHSKIILYLVNYKYDKYTSFFSLSLVIMIMMGQSSCQAICQKSFTVLIIGP